MDSNLDKLVEEGNAHYAAGRFKEAEVWYRAAFRLKPDCAVVLFDLANVLDELHKPFTEDFYLAAISLGSTDALYNLAVKYKREKRYSEAQQMFKRYLDTKPEEDKYTAYARTQVPNQVCTEISQLERLYALQDTRNQLTEGD